MRKPLSSFAFLACLMLALVLAYGCRAAIAAAENPQAALTINESVWKVLRPAMLAFQDGGAREDFLATCKKLLADYPQATTTRNCAL